MICLRERGDDTTRLNRGLVQTPHRLAASERFYRVAGRGHHGRQLSHRSCEVRGARRGEGQQQKHQEKGHLRNHNAETASFQAAEDSHRARKRVAMRVPSVLATFGATSVGERQWSYKGVAHSTGRSRRWHAVWRTAV